MLFKTSAHLFPIAIGTAYSHIYSFISSSFPLKKWNSVIW